MTPSYKIENERIYFTTKYNSDFINDVKNITGRKYDSDNKIWSAPINDFTLSSIKDIIEKYHFEESVINVDHDLTGTLILLSLEDRLEKKSIWLKQKISSEIKLPFELYPYQINGIVYMLETKRCINACDMGTGKTVMAIMAVEVENLFPCLLVLPTSVKYNWFLQWGLVNSKRNISIVDKDNVDLKADVFIVSYDSLGKNEVIEEDTKVVLKIPELTTVLFKSAICDEAQALKSSKTVRSKALKKIIRKIEYRFLLTGTPILNRPSEIINLLYIIKQFEVLFSSWNEFIYRYCGAYPTRFGIDYSGASNTVELNEKLRKLCYYRVEKRSVLKDLPERIDTILKVDLDNYSEYSKAKNDLISYLKTNYGQLKADNALMAEQLVLINTLLQICAKGKFINIIEWINNFLETGNKLVVFGIHTDIIKRLSELYDCDYITGEVNAKKRFDIIQDFKINNKEILFMNIMTGGVGIDGLQEVCSNALFIELPWRYADIEQAVSRLERAGQRNNIFSYFMISKNTIEEDIWDVLLSKREITGCVNSGKEFIASGYLYKLLNKYL